MNVIDLNSLVNPLSHFPHSTQGHFSNLEIFSAELSKSIISPLGENGELCWKTDRDRTDDRCK